MHKPGAYCFIGNGDTPMVHHPMYDFDDSTPPIGAAYRVALTEHSLGQESRQGQANTRRAASQTISRRYRPEIVLSTLRKPGMQLTTLLTTIEIAATIAFSMSGLIEATRRKMDIVGVFSVTFVSAFAGGTLRDVLLDRRPLFWVEHTEYIWLVAALVLSAPLLLRSREHHLTDKVMEVVDALGLGLFTISGASLALVAGMPLIVALLLGSITGVFGGATRDVLCNEIPTVYRDHRPYTLCTLIGGALFIALDQFGVSPHLSTLVRICSIAGLRLLALACQWRIPAWPRDTP